MEGRGTRARSKVILELMALSIVEYGSEAFDMKENTTVVFVLEANAKRKRTAGAIRHKDAQVKHVVDRSRPRCRGFFGFQDLDLEG